MNNYSLLLFIVLRDWRKKDIRPDLFVRRSEGNKILRPQTQSVVY